MERLASMGVRVHCLALGGADPTSSSGLHSGRNRPGVGAGRTLPPWQALKVEEGMNKQLGSRQHTNDECFGLINVAVW